ncbi:dTMP kinase [Chondrocystis sp. NIES-4102]|nr:dTMP kinase [Chondrocystis sp. NIES-4102]
MSKLFIVFEGIDSSGKSTQAELLKEYLIATGDKAIISSEPSNGVIGNLIRQALKRRILFSKDKDLFDEQMAYLFASDRHDHLYNDFDGVFKLIEKDYHVISTRYYFSSLAYNCESEEKLRFIQQLNARFPNPDITIYIDIPVEVALTRLQKRSSQEIYETQTKLTKVREQYQKIFTQYQGKYIHVDGTQSQEQIHQQIVEYISQL